VRPCRNCLRKGIRCMERACTACNGSGEGDGEGGRCLVCRLRVDGEGDIMMPENMADGHLNGQDLIYPNIAPQLQGPPHHQQQLTHPHPHAQNFDQMHLAVMGTHTHSHPRYAPPLPAPDQAQAYHQMMTLARHSHSHSHHPHPHPHPVSAQASLTHTPIQTPTHSRPPSPRRNISSVRFEGELAQHHPVMHLPPP